MRSRIERHEGFVAYHEAVATTRCRQVTAESLAEVFAATRSPSKVVDLGCGDGRSLDLFRRILPDAEWCGLDVEDSPEAVGRRRTDGNFAVFDGTSLPYEDDSVDLVFCKQVLHHVQNPDLLIRDVARVLKPGGAFVGPTSVLETYQSRSLRSYTPYGLTHMLRNGQLEGVRLYPGVDALTLFFYHLLHEPKFFYWFFNRVSPLNFLFDSFGWIYRLDYVHRNFMKIQFAGHVGFMAFKPENAPEILPRDNPR